ncbi:MAG: hypothetical protein LUQ69_00870 [Methanoregulaceae archaeon]|nr:hypothetical protein [Methanoregulaceae archaeon]
MTRIFQETRDLIGRTLYRPAEQKVIMKKQAVQKTQGHKGRDRSDSASPVSSKAADPISKGQIDSLKDKNAAKKKMRKR